MYEFCAFPNRKNTDSIKWDTVENDVIPMWVADMDFPVAPELNQAILDRVSHPVYGYPDEKQRDLKGIIARHYEKLYHLDVPKEWIVWTPSVISGMTSALQMLGGSFMYCVPMYNHIRVLTKEAKLPVIEVAMKREGMYYEMDLDAMEKALTPDVKTFVLCNPHNPVGRVFHRKELQEVQEFCSRHGLVLISDEIHSELDFENRHIPYFSLNEGAAAHGITLCSAGKICNIPGLPMGYAIIPDKALRDRFTAEQEGRLPAHNVVTLAAYRKAYDGSCDRWKGELREYLKENRDYLIGRINAVPGLAIGRNEGTYLAWIDCSGLQLEDPYRFFLEKARVMFSPGEVFGDKQFIRLNFGCPRSQLQEVLDRVERAVLELSK